MKKYVLLFLCLGIFALPLCAQSGRTTRPRVVVTPPAPTAPAPNYPVSSPPVLQTGSGAGNNSAQRPPVLIGSKPTNQPANTTTAETAIDDENEVIKVETNLVTMPVSVLDRNGRFISGLQKNDFQIFDNGIAQKIEYFQPVEQPFSVILLIDVSPSTQYKINQIQDAAINFINKLRQDDRVMVISFDERVHVLSPLTNNRNALRNAILQTEFGDGTSLYEAVDFTIRRQLAGIKGRKAVVMFTDGVDTTSRRASLQGTVAEAQELDALIYPVRYDTFQGQNGGYGGNYPNPRRRSGGGGWGNILGTILSGGNVSIGSGGGNTTSAGGSRSDYETGRKYLQALATNSGGRMFEANNNLDTAFSGIAEELRQQYSVGYYPEKEGAKGEKRLIRVRVMRPNLVVRAKDSYIVGENDNQKFAGK